MMDRQKGFTLIELTIMIGVGAVLLVGLGVASQAQLKSVVDNRNFLVALHLAKQEMAVMNNSAYPAVQAETALTADSAFPNFIPTEEVVSVATSGSNSIREIRIRVRHGSAGGPVLVDLRTYRSDIVTFGNGT